MTARQEPHDPRIDAWRERLAGAPTALELPTDRRRPPIAPGETAAIPCALPSALRNRLEALGTAAGGGLHDVLLAAWALLLHRYSGNDEVVIGVTRPRAGADDAARPAGFWCVRADLSADPAFSDLVDRVGGASREARAAAHVPIGVALEALAGSAPDPSRHPVYQASFDGVRIESAAGTGNACGPLADRLTAPSDLDLQLVAEAGEDGATLHLVFATALFDRQSATRMLDHLRRLLEAVADRPDLAASRIPLLGASERDRVLHEWNDTATAIRDTTLMFQPFEANAAAHPDRTALLFEDETVRYGELNARANRLAHHLRREGVAPDSLVAVCLERSIELVVALLAVQKAGAAYVPLDPAHPKDRLRFMVEDAGAPFVVTEAALVDRLPDGAHRITIDREPDRDAIAACDPADPEPVVTAASRAYIIYTSGSTGLPKGVVVRHPAALNLIDWVNTTFDVGPEDRLLFVTSPTFDLSVYDVFGMLAAGGSLRIASSRELAEPDALVEHLCRGGITFWDSAPAALGQLVPFLPEAAPASDLRLVFLSGDWIPVPLPDQLRTVFEGAEVVSLGGATEATVWSNVFRIGEVDPAWNSIPYGRPIRNARYYVLDRHLEPTADRGAGRAVHRRAVPRERLPRETRTQRRTLPRRPVRRRRRQALPHGRHRAVPARRQPRVHGPCGPSGQGARLPDRAGRDRGRAGPPPDRLAEHRHRPARRHG